jgi:hypothetical protein
VIELALARSPVAVDLEVGVMISGTDHVNLETHIADDNPGDVYRSPG